MQSFSRTIGLSEEFCRHMPAAIKSHENLNGRGVACLKGHLESGIKNQVNGSILSK
jgi:hypothetical protein